MNCYKGYTHFYNWSLMNVSYKIQIFPANWVLVTEVSIVIHGIFVWFLKLCCGIILVHLQWNQSNDTSTYINNYWSLWGQYYTIIKHFCGQYNTFATWEVQYCKMGKFAYTCFWILHFLGGLNIDLKNVNNCFIIWLNNLNHWNLLQKPTKDICSDIFVFG